MHLLVEAVQLLKQLPGAPPCRLRVAGWLGENNRGYLRDLVEKIRAWGWSDDFEHVECPDHASKLAFLQSLDILSVPTVYREPKGLYVLEALASGVPVVQPAMAPFRNSSRRPAAVCSSIRTIRPTWPRRCGICWNSRHCGKELETGAGKRSTNAFTPPPWPNEPWPFIESMSIDPRGSVYLTPGPGKTT